jgi:hypothetical protein
MTSADVLFGTYNVRGNGDAVLTVVAQIVATLGGRAFDVSTSEFLTGDPAETAGWHGFQQFRDKIRRVG